MPDWVECVYLSTKWKTNVYLLPSEGEVHIGNKLLQFDMVNREFQEPI